MMRGSGAIAFERGPKWRLGLGLTIVLAALFALCPPATAASAPGWAIKVVAMPTAFSAADNTACVANEKCDKYAIVATNVGSAASAGVTTVKDVLPAAGVTPFQVHASDLGTGAPIPCAVNGAVVECADSEPVPAYGSVLVDVQVLTEPGAGTGLQDSAEVSGGGAAAPSQTLASNRANAATAPQFGVTDFAVKAYDASGASDEQAGARLGALSSSFDFVNVLAPGASGSSYLSVEEPKSITVELPLGLIGNPQATAEKCSEVDLATKPPASTPGFTSECPARSRIGTVVLDRQTEIESSQGTGSVSALYNIEPEPGYPAVFGFRFLSAAVFMYARVVPTPTGYRLKITAPDIPHAAGSYKVIGAIMTFFGVPNLANRLVGAEPLSFIRNPTSCANSAEAMDATMEVNTWVKPAKIIAVKAPVYNELTGCDFLRFDPSLEVVPEQATSDTPSQFTVSLRTPQPQRFEEGATPDLKYASAALPVGVSLAPPLAAGLQACTEAEIDPTGTELGEGHPGGNDSPYDDGLEHPAPGRCPDASRVGAVEVKTPLLEEPLKGGIYVAQPSCGGEGQPECTTASASNGELYGLYLEVAGSGVVMKLRGKVTADAKTGQLTTTFAENPQLPFEELKLTFNKGPRAPLATPQSCGTFVTTSEIEPWSAPASGPDARPTSAFGIGGCSEPSAFAPSFTAGTTSAVAGGFSPLTVTISRRDGEQDIGGVSVTLPPGLAGRTVGVTRCDETNANTGACPQSSRIGTAHVAAGAGPEPLWLEGPVYLTGPYRGAPLGLSVVIPVKVGPFNLGSEVVRSAIDVDPHTAQTTTTTEPLRLIRDGVPFRMKTINVVIDRPQFIFNPTDCKQEQVIGSVSGDRPDGTPGTTTAVSTPFAVNGCQKLAFHPRFSVLTDGKTSKANGASLEVKAINPSGSVNVREVRVSLPKQLPSRLETLKLACVDHVFNANPAACPPASAVGMATALTPILAHTVTGPAYLVSHGGAEFPDLEIVLQGEEVTLVLDGKTDVKKNITTSTFSTLPDAPVTSFDLKLPAGPHSVLGAPGGKLCSERMTMPTMMRGQNGALFEQDTKLAVGGCKPAVLVLGHSVKGAEATIVASVPAAGTLTAGGSGLSRVRRRARRAEQVRFKLELTRSERAFLARHRGRRLRARVWLSFVPQHGKRLSTGVTLLIG